MVYTGQGIFTGALTTAGAFLAMYFTNFQGIKEMGLICGGGLLVCFIPMMTMLPVLLLRGRQNVIDHQIHVDDRRARIENIWLQRPVLVAGIVVGAPVRWRCAWLRRAQGVFRLQPHQDAKPQPVVGGV
jgi:predicted RND superfamily exporter protein